MVTTTQSTGHLAPTREAAKGIVLNWADAYNEAETGHESLEDLYQYVRRLSVELHADVRSKDFDLVLEAVTEVRDVEAGNHEQLTPAPDDNYPDLLDAKRQAMDAAIGYLLDQAGFGVSPRSIAA